MAYNNGPSLSFQRREEERRWKEYLKGHKERLKSIKPTMKKASNNERYDYLHLQLRLKRLQMEEDKFAEIDYENRKLLARIMGIMGKDGRLDNWKTDYRPGGGLHKETKKIEDRRIEEENRKLLSRLDRVRGQCHSAPNIPDLIKQTRERNRADEDRRIKEENKALKERIDAVKPQLSLTPPATLHSPRTEPFGNRFSHSMRILDKENRLFKERVYHIMQGKGRVDNWNKNFKLKGSANSSIKEKQIDEENKALHDRIVNAKGSIDFQKLEKQYKDVPKLKKSNPYNKSKEARVIEENKRMQERLVRIMETSRDFTWNHGEISKQTDRMKKLDQLKKAIEQENQVMSDRLRDIKPTMHTLDQNSPQRPTKAWPKDPHAKENERLKQRIKDIKEGKHRPSLSYNDPSQKSTPSPRSKSKENSEESHSESVGPPRKEGHTEDDEGTEREKTTPKVHNVPPGYKKKFRKRRKKSDASKSTGDGEDDEEEEESSTDSEA